MISTCFHTCRLVIAARTVEKLADTQSECLKNTPHVHIVRADVSKEEDCRAIVDKAVEQFGGVDILILNAAYSPNPRWFSDYENPVSACMGLLFCTCYTIPYKLMQHPFPSMFHVYPCVCFMLELHAGGHVL